MEAKLHGCTLSGLHRAGTSCPGFMVKVGDRQKVLGTVLFLERNQNERG